MSDIDKLLQYLNDLGGGRGPASEQTMLDIAKGLNISTTAGIVSVNSGEVKKNTGAFKEGTKALNIFTNGLGGVVSSLIAYSKEQRKVSTIIRDVGDSFRMVSGVTKGFSDFMSVLDENFSAFKKLSQAGVFAGDDIDRLTRTAAQLGIDLDKLTSFTAGSAEDIARLGVGTAGLNTLFDEQTKAIKENYEELNRFGFTFEETNEKFLSFLNQNSFALRRFGEENVNLTQGSKEYSIFLRRLSELTGKQVDQVEDEVKKARANSIYNAFVQSIQDPTTRKKYDQIVMQYGTLYGDAGREFAMATLAGLPPLTRGSQQLGAMVQGLASDVSMHRSLANNSAQSVNDFSKTLMSDTISRTRQLGNTMLSGGMNQTALAVSMAGGDLGPAFEGIYNAIMIGQQTQEEIDQLFDNQKETLSENVDNMGKFDIVVKNSREAIARATESIMKSGGFVESLDTASTKLKELTDEVLVDILNANKSVTDPDSVVKNDEEQAESIKTKIIEMLTGNQVDRVSQSDIGKIVDAIKIGGEEGQEMLKKFFAGSFENELKKIKREYELGGGERKLGSFDNFVADLLQEMMKRNTKYLADSNYNADDRTKAQGNVGHQMITDAIPKFNKGTLNMGGLFQNFGKGQLAMLHGEEAVVPKDSPMGNILNMMQGGSGGIMDAMKKGDLGSVINQGTALGTKIDAYAKENQGAIQSQADNFAKSMGIPQEMIDEAKKNPVKSNSTVNNSTSNISNSSSFGSSKKIDELIRVNKQMLEAIRNM